MAFAYKVAALIAAGGTAYSSVPQAQCKDDDKPEGKGWFDPEALERGAKAIREIDRSTNAKRVYDTLKEQEKTKQSEEASKQAASAAQAAEYEAQREGIKQQEERRREQERAKFQAELMQRQAEVDRRKTQEEHELSRQRNKEYLDEQSKMTLQVQAEKLRYEQQIQAEKRATANHEAELQKQVAIERALAEGRARAQEHRENRDIFMEEIGTNATEWGKQYMVLLQESFKSLGTGARLLLTTEYGTHALYGAAGLFFAYYGIRGGVNLTTGQLERWLTTPALVRETSRFHLLSRLRNAVGLGGASIVNFDRALQHAEKTFSDVVLAPNVKHSIRSLAASAANTRLHGAPFRHFLFYGPPGTGKTLVAKRLAHTSGLDYAIMSGGDVGPLGANAVKQIHDTFDWAVKSPKGMILFVDEADAFLSRRDGDRSEAMRSAINALLYRTGDQSRDFMVVLATNRPEDLDPAVLDRVDEQLKFDKPDAAMREELLALYFRRYVEDAAAEAAANVGFFSGLGMRVSAALRGNKAFADNITLANFDKATLLREAAQLTEGFSGRELAKLMASVQSAAYATPTATLTPELFRGVVQTKLEQHEMRLALQ